MLSNEDGSSQMMEETDTSYKQKYRDLKRRLKYLVYENECFEKDIRESQLKLLQINREKSFLLDQLMAHETIVLSDNSDMDSTDYSSEEEKSSTYSETVTKKTQSSKLPTSSPKPPVTKTSNTRGVSKKQGVKGSHKQTTPKAVKTISKPAVSSASASNTTSALIVSLPLKIGQLQQQQPQAQQPPKLISTVTTKELAVTTTHGKKPSAIGGKGKRPSPSSSSGSSSSSSSNSDSGSSDSSDGEESMDVSETKPSLPPPLLLDSTVPMAITVAHPKPLQSPIRIMAPGTLTSLSTIPVLSPSNSSPTVTTKLLPSKTLTPEVTPPITNSSSTSSSSTKSPSLVATIGGNPLNISAFHIVQSDNTKLLNNR